FARKTSVPLIREPVDYPDGPARSREITTCAVREPTRIPDAANATAPGHLLRALEWRTGLEYLAARRGLRHDAGWPRGDGHPVLVSQGSWLAHCRRTYCAMSCAAWDIGSTTGAWGTT